MLSLSCAYDIQMNVRPGKCLSICSDSQVALKALQAAKIMLPLRLRMPPLVWQCPKLLSYCISRPIKADSHIPCRSAKALDCVFSI
jgi:hypothetical protein